MAEHADCPTAYVFLSYASADREQALRIAELFEAAGVPVWIDRQSIEGGTTWTAEIVQGVEGSAAVLVLCSAGAMRSRNVRQEIQLAWEANRPVLPLLLEAVTYPPEIRYALVGRQWVEVLDLPEEIWLPRALRALAGLGVASPGRVTDLAPSTEAGPAVTGPAAPAKAAAPEATEAPADAHPTDAQATGARPPDARPAASRPGSVVPASPLSRLRARAPLVGRAEQLDFLKAEYESVAAGGGGRLILISGEPGVGKTRLAQEAGHYAQERGGRFLAGHYLRDGTAAYGPWVEALRAGLRGVSRAELAQMVGSYGPELAQAVPELVEPLGPFPPPPALSPDEQRRRLFDGLAGLVITLSQRTPLVLLLDDLQWAPGLSVLAHVARRLGEARVLILGTYREQEFKEQPALMREWAELNRARLATELHLHPLSDAETAELVAHYFGSGPTAQLRGPIYHRTHGNAFFTEEVLRSLTETGAVRAVGGAWEVADPNKVTIPHSMRLAVEERVARLGEEACDVLVQASVLGQEFGLPVLAAMMGRPEDDLIEILDRAMSTRVLVDRSTGGEERFAFLDDQIQEVLYASISPIRKRRFHVRAGQALEKVYVGRLEAQLDELARHFAEANDAAKAADYALRAAERNVRLFNRSRAKLLYERALSALTQLPETNDVRRRRIDAILKLVDVAYAIEEPGYELSRLAEAESLAQALSGPNASRDDHVRLARIHFWLGRIHYTRGDYRAAKAFAEQGLESALASGNEEITLLCSSAIGRALLMQGYPGRALPLLTQVIGPLQATASDYERILASGYLAMAQVATGNVAQGLAEVQRSMALSAIGDPRCLGNSYMLQAGLYFLVGDLPRLWEVSHAGAQVAQEHDLLGYVYWCLVFRAWAESRLRRLEAAYASFAASRAIAERFGGRLNLTDWLAAAEAELALNAGQVEKARAFAQRAVTHAQEVGGIFAEGLAQRVWGQALAALDPPRWDEAEEHLATSLRCFEEGVHRLEAARTRVAWAMLCRDCRDTTAAREHLEKAAAQFEASGLTEELQRTRALMEKLGG